ncbi:MAG: hypothetical protein SGILL_000019 [Bacillariaceae sp.]
MNTTNDNKDKDDYHRATNGTATQTMKLDADDIFEVRRQSGNNSLLCDWPRDGKSEMTSFGGISLSSFDGGLSGKEMAAFNSREEVEDFLGRLSACASSKDDDNDDVKPAARSDGTNEEGKNDKESARTRTDWDSMFHQAICRSHSHSTSITSATGGARSSDTSSNVPDPSPRTRDELPAKFFTSRPHPDNNDLSSLSLLSLSDPDWLVKEATAAGVVDDPRLRDLFLKTAAPAAVADRSVASSQPSGFQQFYDVRKLTQESHTLSTDDRKQASGRNTTSPLDSASTHTTQSSKSGKSRQSEPVEKQYVEEITDCDVLMGRGGRSNHHPGNHFYLALIAQIKPKYEECKQKSEKTRVAQSVVDFIHHKRKGRFVELDSETGRWYVADNRTARTKAGQALRDKNTAEARAEKRKKYGC